MNVIVFPLQTDSVNKTKSRQKFTHSATAFPEATSFSIKLVYLQAVSAAVELSFCIECGSEMGNRPFSQVCVHWVLHVQNDI